jgi:hypothetical protein
MGKRIKMENIVPCKRCQKDFVYIPGPAGNARQLCKECRDIADDEELEQFKEQLIVEKNKYLIGAPGRKDIYDPANIILFGELPEFKSDSERFICAMEVGLFIQNNGITGCEENVAKFLWHLGQVHRIVCLKQWHLKDMEVATKSEKFKDIIESIMKIVNE